MHIPWDMLVTIVVSAFGSTGLWSIVQYKMEQKSALKRMILGLGYYKLVRACEEYLEQGWISIEEYGDLNKYLYQPYVALGGNGTAQALMSKVEKLPNHPAE